MPLLQVLRPTLPILIGASIMLTLSMGLRQSLGIFMQPLTHDIHISISDFTLALAVQNLAWGFLQPLAGALTGVSTEVVVADLDAARGAQLLQRRHAGDACEIGAVGDLRVVLDRTDDMDVAVTTHEARHRHSQRPGHSSALRHLL